MQRKKSQNKMSKQKFYTVSTRIFTSLREAEDMITKWNECEGLQQGSKVFEVIKVYSPRLKLVEDPNVFVRKLEKEVKKKKK